MNTDEPANVSMAQSVDQWVNDVTARVSAGDRFAGMFGSAQPDGCRVTALLAGPDGMDAQHALVSKDSAGRLSYPSLTPQIPSAFWYERAAHDLSGLQPEGHPRPDPLLLSVHEGNDHPRPGNGANPDQRYQLRSTTPTGPVDVQGRGMFAMSLGPVRSGVFESIEFLIETPGEDIPHINIRPHYKHRGVAKSFEGLTAEDGVLDAERVEGIASVAHAVAFSHAVERMTNTPVPLRAQLLRLIHAELERISNHLDVAMRLTEAAGLAVATSRFGWHKESVMRLTSRLCGSRFGRGVVVPGGVRHEPLIDLGQARTDLLVTLGKVRADATLAMRTPSFLDRLRGTGYRAPSHAQAWGALGPVGRASGVNDDNRWSRPTDAYAMFASEWEPAAAEDGDVMARLRVRWMEIDVAGSMALAAINTFGKTAGPLRTDIPAVSGRTLGLGWTEAPQGETVYAVEMQDDRIVRCFARSASFHNLVLFHEIYHGDVLTDFAFNEASFGLGYAAVAM